MKNLVGMGARRREMRGWSRTAAAIGILSIAGAFGGCGNTISTEVEQPIRYGPPEGLEVGVATTVGIRPDVLGAARDLPVPVETGSINGSTVTMSGTLHGMNGDWIVLDDTTSGQRRWIRIESVNWVRQAIPAGSAMDDQPATDHGNGHGASDGTHGDASHGD